MFRRSFYNGLLTSTIFPVAAIALLWAALGTVAHFAARYRKTLITYCTKGTFYVLFLVYPSVSGVVLMYFSCIQARAVGHGRESLPAGLPCILALVRLLERHLPRFCWMECVVVVVCMPVQVPKG